MPMTSEAAKRYQHHRNLGKYALPEPAAIRFWKSFEEQEGCWLWRGPFADDGYGVMSSGNRPVRAHRFAWELLIGPIIPKSLFVCHRCDTPTCVNPEHLFLGTQQDNMQDMAVKGRSPRGDKHWSRAKPELVARGERQNSKLNEAQVLEIRRRAITESYASLSREFGVNGGQIRRIYLRERWGWLD